jgi:acyl transferase domain-containing protein
MSANDVAIVGMACIFPGARNLRQYWANLVNGVDAVSDPPGERWRDHRNFDPGNQHEAALPGRRAGFLPTDLIYDPMPHRVLPNLVKYGDPDQFMMLDIIDRALADAQVAEDAPVRRRTDVIIGRGGYPTGKLGEMALRVEMIDTIQTILSWNAPDLFDPSRRTELEKILRKGMTPKEVDNVSTCIPNLTANRAANRLNLRGSSYTVDGACASSLLAVEQAVWRLRNGLSDQAVAAGLFLNLTPTFMYVFSSVGALSPAQVIRPFDRRADGLLAGEGGGAVVLKRLADAQRDGDAIYAIIKGVGSASDGKEVDVMAPAIAGQIKALEMAYADGHIDPDTIGFLEAHGTATLAGDLTEIHTIKQFFGKRRGLATPRTMGSVKSMIGHLMPAAGMAAIIKMALSLSHRIMPPSLHCEEPRPELEDAPFYVLSQTRPWLHNPGRGPRRCGINSFGFGGINAHVILEEVPDPAPPRRSTVVSPGGEVALKRRPFVSARARAAEVLPFAAPSRPALIEQLRQLRNYLEQDRTEPTLADVSATLCQKADLTQPVKLAFVAADLGELPQRLDEAMDKLARGTTPEVEEETYFSEQAAAPCGKIACVIPGTGFPGMSGNYPDHLLELCLNFPEVRAEFDLFEDRDGHPQDNLPTSLLFCPPLHLPPELRYRLKLRLAPPRIDEVQGTEVPPDQRSIASVSISLAGWLSWVMFRKFRVPVDMITGQSQGEIPALCAAGMGDFHDVIPGYWKSLAVDLVPPTDTRLAFLLTSAERLEPVLARYTEVEIAIYMAPEALVVGGPTKAIEALLDELHSQAIAAHLLPYGTIHTSHLRSLRSQMVELSTAQLLELYPPGAWEERKPQIAIYSSVTASKYPPEGERVLETMVMNLDHPLRLWQTIQQMYDDGARVFIQAGVSNAATDVVILLPDEEPTVSVMLDREELPPLEHLAHACARLFTAGVPLDFAPLHEHRALRVLDFATPREAPPPPPLGIPLLIHCDSLSAHRAIRENETPAADIPAAPAASEAPLVEPAAVPSRPVTPERPLPILGAVTRQVAGKELAIERALSLDEDLFLHDHLFVSSGSKPVAERIAIVPLTMSLEFAAEAACLLAPECVLVGFEHVRGRRWIHVKGTGNEVLRTEVVLEHEDLETSVRKFRVTHTFDGQLCFSVLALFAPAYRQDLQLDFADPGDAGPWSYTPEQVYGERIMFHGPRFQGITNLGQMGNPASTAILTVLPKDQLFASKPEPELLCDPCLLDAMGQSFGLWAAAHGEVILPIGVEKIEVYGPPAPPGTELLLRLEVISCDPDTRQIRCNMQVEDATGFVHVRMAGWTDWLLNWPENYFLSMRLPEWHTLSQEVMLPGMPPDAVCTLVRRDDFHNVEVGWAASLFMHTQECAALAAAEGTTALGDPFQRGRDVVYGLAGVKDAVRIWWARQYGGAMPHPSEFCVSHDDAGQPYLQPAGDPSLPCISCAHSEGTFLAVAATTAAGVDLEPVTRDAPAILSEFATEEEIALLDHLAASDPDALWALRLWCAKEAMSKLLGTGLQGRPKDFLAIDGDPGGGFLMHHLPSGSRFVVYTSRLENYILAYTSATLAASMPAEPAYPEPHTALDPFPGGAREQT